MRVILAAGLLASAARAVRIVQANDDGWAELYVTSLHDALLEGGHDPVLCGPAENKSGTSKFLLLLWLLFLLLLWA